MEYRLLEPRPRPRNIIQLHGNRVTLKGLDHDSKFELTLALLGYLKTRICLGGGQFDPPSKSHVLCPNMTNDTSLESSCAFLLESAKKFAKIEFFIAKSSFIVKMFAKKNLSKK